jgi:hypothetical protein
LWREETYEERSPKFFIFVRSCLRVIPLDGKDFLDF